MIGIKSSEMKISITFKDGAKNFEASLAGFIQALSYKESSSDLKLSISHPINIRSAGKANEYGYLGLFQFGEESLYELGYYAGDHNISYADLKSNPSLKQKWQNQFSNNNWSGSWTGKRNINSKSDFLNNPQVQYEIIKEWIAYLCKQLRNNCINEYYGKTVGGVEITESGAIAGAHLVGLAGLGAFLGIPKKAYAGKKQTDGNGTHIKQYIKDFGGFDLENCCNRKIYIELMDKTNNPLVSKEVTIISTYSGKYASGETRVKAISDENGKLPVIVRHPNSEIKILADGKESNVIVQKANEKQKAILSDFSITKYSAALAETSTPQPAPQVDKTPQELRNEKASGVVSDKEPNEVKQEVKFNISIVEGDSGRVITSLRFYVTYKGNIKEHRTDQQGIKQGIVAEEGQDIEVSVAGEGGYQVIHHFKVSLAVNSQTIKIKLPVQSFEILVKKDGKPVPNTLFSVFYRSREIGKRTNAQGMIKVKMLVGFVYGFGIHEHALTHVRVIKGNARREFTVNESTVKASKLFEVAEQKQKQANQINAQQQAHDKAAADAKKARDAAEKAKADQEKAASNQQDTHTQNTGKPLTTVGAQAPATSDTTNYYIYSNGTIDRVNKAATGYAAYYYVEDNKPIYIGKSKIYIADRWASKNVKGSGKTYLVSIRDIFNDTNSQPADKWEKSLNNLKISIANDSKGQSRYWLSTAAFAAYIGAVCRFGEKTRFSGFSDKSGGPGESSSHINGEVGDIGYIRKDRNHLVGVNFNMDQYDHNASLNFVNILISFGWGKNKKMLSENYPTTLIKNYNLNNGYILPKCNHYSKVRHNNHLHLQGLTVQYNKDE